VGDLSINVQSKCNSIQSIMSPILLRRKLNDCQDMAMNIHLSSMPNLQVCCRDVTVGSRLSSFETHMIDCDACNIEGNICNSHLNVRPDMDIVARCPEATITLLIMRVGRLHLSLMCPDGIGVAYQTGPIL
jgi:hypothetical protein